MVCGCIGLLTALITAVYTGRQYGQVFLGSARDEHTYQHAHESPPVMTIPLFILAAGAVLAGLLGVPHISGVPEMFHAFPNWLAPLFTSTHGEPGVEHVPSIMLLLAGLVIGWAGWFGGLTLGKNAAGAALPESTHALSLDAIYGKTIIPAGYALAAVLKWVDENVVDGVVSGVGVLIAQVSDTIKYVQTSYVRTYAFTMAVGAIFVVAYFLIQRGQ